MKDRPIVLIVDDQPDNLYMYANYLETEAPLGVVTAMSGREAVVKAKRFQPDVILLDLSMPQMDGYQVARELARDPDTRDIPVILLSAYASEAEAARALGQSFASFVGSVAQGYVSKPCLPDVLLQHVRQVVPMAAAS
jgi:CheY-like chemotaxis protein